MQDQLTLDLDLYTSNAPIIDNLTSTYTVTPQTSYDFGLSASKWTSSPSITTGSYAVTTGTPAMSSITTASTITIGDQSFGEEQIKIINDLRDWQKQVDAKLAILKPNEELEEQWDELKELRNRYVELEAELTEKAKMWDILKD
jgi:hypothetical protein|tara:strand:+ start:320 stop:751 length:432 start_codon:yes stop_codon:yes gene_type:complete